MQDDFTHILVPHDGSEMSDKALDEAVRFAKLFNAKITLLHVVDERFAPPSVLLSFIKERTSLKEAKAELFNVLKTGAENMLNDRMEKIKGKGVDAVIEIGVGSPPSEIIKRAKAENVDIIIMGSRKFKSVGKLKSLGSVARRVSEMSECPVMLVH
jgi:nucleotide-binding universal stress UspA family protein